MQPGKTMMAVVKEKPGPGFAWKEVPCPEIRADQVLVQVKAVGICGSDIPIFNGIRAVPEGLIPGHEFAGVIAQVGQGVEGWAVGDRVAVGLVVGCGRCYYCKIGQESMCEDILELGIHLHGAYTAFTAVPQTCLHRLPDNLSFEEGAAVDPIASAYRGVRKVAVDVEDSVVIFGPGAIGLYALQTVKARGAHTVVVVGQPEDGPRLEVAKQLGADHVFTPQDGNVADRVAKVTDGRMASVVIEATGNPAAMPTVLSCAARQARVLVIGISHAEATFNPVIIVRRELQVMGSFCYSWEDFEESLWLLARGKITTRKMVTHVMALEQLGQALELLRERTALKVILRP
jgi:L-iditol 2-dehydrogenase